VTNARENLLLTALIVVMVIIIAVVTSHCQVTEHVFKSPGLKGMVSNVDIDAHDPQMSPYMLNLRTDRTGRLRPRLAIDNYGTNATKVYGAFGYHNPLTNHKLIVGVTDHATYPLGQFVVSDTFGTEVGTDTLSGTIFPYADIQHYWTRYKDALIHCDGKSIPAIFSTSQYFLYDQTKPDTFGFAPHVISMGMEAPGQPRVGLVGGSGNLDDRYIYAVAFQSDSVIGIQSRPVYPKNQNVYITNLPQDSAF
jgi:hypothetical protein